MLSLPTAEAREDLNALHEKRILWDDFRSAFGQNDPDRLVWRAPSILMNPALGESRLARERRLDPSCFAREYEAEFAEDLEAFLPYGR